jgi:hypothetical protein
MQESHDMGVSLGVLHCKALSISQDNPGSTIQAAWNEQKSWPYVFSNKATERHKRVDTEEKKVY